MRHYLEDSTSLPSDWVMAITESADGFIWVGTEKGICKVDPGHLECTRYAPGHKMQADVSARYVTVAADEKGTIWALTANYLLHLEKDSFICTDRVISHGSIQKGQDGEILLTCHSQLLIKNTRTGKLKEQVSNVAAHTDYTCLYQDVKGNYWVGTWADGLAMLDKSWNHEQHFRWDLEPVNPSTTNIISSISGDDRYVYVGTSNGLYIYDIRQQTDINTPLYHLIHQPEDKLGISSGMVSHVFIDNSDNIWVSTSSGVNVCLSLNRTYRSCATGTGFTTDIEYTDNGSIISSWYGKGVCFYDKRMNLLHSQPYVPEYVHELNNSQVSGLDTDTAGNLWIATFNGLSCYSLEAGKTLQYYTKENTGLATNRLNDVWYNPYDHEVWTANYDAGISRLKLSTGEVENIHLADNPAILDELIWTFYEDGTDLWILSNTGLVRYHCLEKKWDSWDKVNIHGNGIPVGKCYDLLKDSHGIYWLGTENGLFIYYRDKWFFRSIEHGLPERGVGSIAEDKNGNIWIGFNNSILCFDTHTFSTFILSGSNGILLPEINFIFIDPRTDELFLVSEGSIYTIDKERILAMHTLSPQVYLEEFSINDKSYFTSGATGNPVKNSFAYDQNNVEIGFITPVIGEIGKPVYSYRIGQNGTWSAPGENNRIALPRLRPGNYQMEIRASTDGVHWSEKPLRLDFTIRPPFWRTWWFITGLVLVVLMGIILLVRFVSTRNLKLQILQLEKDQAIEKERSRLSRDMHDDLGSGLTKISILSEVVKKKIHPDAQVDTYLENISDSSRELVQNLNNIIWSLNPGNDTLQALLAYIREYAVQFLESCQVNFEFDAGNLHMDQEVSEQAKRNIFLVVKETLNNAVKHGKAEKITLKVDWSGKKQLVITIHDNGSGMKEKKPAKGNGLKNMEKRMREIGGEWSIHSEPGQGTTVTLVYPVSDSHIQAI